MGLFKWLEGLFDHGDSGHQIEESSRVNAEPLQQTIEQGIMDDMNNNITNPYVTPGLDIVVDESYHGIDHGLGIANPDHMNDHQFENADQTDDSLMYDEPDYDLSGVDDNYEHDDYTDDNDYGSTFDDGNDSFGGGGFDDW